MSNLNMFLEKMSTNDIPQEVINRFCSFFDEFNSKANIKTNWADIIPIKPEAIENQDNLNCSGQNRLNKLAIIKLNGGLGTSMGCQGPKSLIKAKNNKTFIDIIIDQIKEINEKHNIDMPLIFMNSYNTDEQTQTHISNRKDTSCYYFLQNKFPRINESDKQPYSNPNENEEWNPSGHGDVFYALKESGIASMLNNKGIEYLMISNSDNLGAIPSKEILNYLSETQTSFLLEMTHKTKADIKGGTLVNFQNKTKLLEIAQVDPKNINDFQNISNFPLFNTNNIWVHLPTMLTLIKTNQLKTDLIINKKTIQNTPIIQFESAMGSAISSFPNAKALIVDRNRFIPVKTTSDLLRLRSDYYSMQNNTIVLNPNRAQNKEILPINLSAHYKSLDDFEKKIPQIPSLVNCTSLEINTDTIIPPGEVYKGDVIING